MSQIVELFERDKSVISRHINNIFKEGELQKDSVVAKNATTASDGKTYQVDYFNLDVIISIGYRIKSKRGTDFRIWANKILNKRIAAFLFLYFLERNAILYDNKGEKRIADNTLVALTLMIAVSKTDEKEMITKIIVNLINKNNYSR